VADGEPVALGIAQCLVELSCLVPPELFFRRTTPPLMR
jgi:hypothetical protein